ncbi:tyrosine-type recombinase/integrase [Geodermatophilus nigrescens]|uniref:Site-specific recombinase XerD n=1 Tax=Geodermatophilus nigrescens TaxID=1070870 RepID=A0A1M5QVB4_9ACTN|nr:site-specific integrase [Geodermatophilus nigrescens]SHH18065.1 Site-specific recombinase XerD [Geodermatophilus nigrescens]
MGSVDRRANGTWQARYRPAPGATQITRTFGRKVDATRWLTEQTAALAEGRHIHPATAKLTVGEWCDQWLAGYGTRRPSTVRQAGVHLAHIRAAFGARPLAAIRPSDVRRWTAELKAAGAADSYVYALHRRLSQLMSDAVHDGLILRSPCSHRTSPAAGRPRPYVATTEQVFALHDTVAEHLRPAVLLGAFAGLRTAEVAGLRVVDVDFEAGVVTPVEQAGGKPLKSAMSGQSIPIPAELVEQLAGAVRRFPGSTVVTDGIRGPSSTWAIERAVRAARRKHVGLPEDFRFHDLRHYYASLLIASGLDVKTVQHRLRHGSATTTLNTYGHLWPDRDEATRTVVGAVLRARPAPQDHLR